MPLISPTFKTHGSDPWATGGGGLPTPPRALRLHDSLSQHPSDDRGPAAGTQEDLLPTARVT